MNAATKGRRIQKNQDPPTKRKAPETLDFRKVPGRSQEQNAEQTADPKAEANWKTASETLQEPLRSDRAGRIFLSGTEGRAEAGTEAGRVGYPRQEAIS